MNQEEPNQNESPQEQSLVQRLIRDPIQWIANMYVVIGTGINTASVHHCSQADCGGSSGVEPVTLTLGILSLAYTLDNVISHYQGRERTYTEDFFHGQWRNAAKRELDRMIPPEPKDYKNSPDNGDD